MKKREHVDVRLLFFQLQACCFHPTPLPATPPSPSPLLPALLPQSQTQDVRESCIFWRAHPPLSLPSVFLWLRPCDQKKKGPSLSAFLRKHTALWQPGPRTVRWTHLCGSVGTGMLAACQVRIILNSYTEWLMTVRAEEEQPNTSGQKAVRKCAEGMRSFPCKQKRLYASCWRQREV